MEYRVTLYRYDRHSPLLETELHFPFNPAWKPAHPELTQSEETWLRLRAWRERTFVMRAFRWVVAAITREPREVEVVAVSQPAKKEKGSQESKKNTLAMAKATLGLIYPIREENLPTPAEVKQTPTKTKRVALVK